MLDIGGLDEGFPVIGEMPKCSDTLVCNVSFHRFTFPSDSHSNLTSLQCGLPSP